MSGCCTSDGTAWLWGSNVNYQLAKGDEEEDNVVPGKLIRTKVGAAFGQLEWLRWPGAHTQSGQKKETIIWCRTSERELCHLVVSSEGVKRQVL